MKEHVTEFVMYSGLRTIGGVNASITYGKDRVIFEFGAAYSPSTSVFDGTVAYRAKNWVCDMLRIGLLPKIGGIYRKQDLGGYPLVSAEESDVNTAVFITHLHLDHMALVGTIAPAIPVYMHHSAQTIERALETTGEGILTLERDYMDIVPFQPIRVGAIEVLPILCRDISYFDFAFLITTPDGTIHWTGDLSMHGVQADKTLAQMKLLKARNIDVMLCDCTAFMDPVMQTIYNTTDASVVRTDPHIPHGMLSEQQYQDGIWERIRDCEGLCVFNYYQREMDEAQQYMTWANMCARCCVFEPDAAYLVHKFFGVRPNVYIPDSTRYSENRAKEWMDELLANAVVVTADEIHANPAGYLLQNSYRHILELFSLPSGDALYIHEGGTPIGEFDTAYSNMRNIIQIAGFEYSNSDDHYFGHAYPSQVKYFVDQVAPKVLIPCHSYNPERLTSQNATQLLPEPYQTYVLENHQFTVENKRSVT